MILGHYHLSEQTPASLAREQFGEGARRRRSMMSASSSASDAYSPPQRDSIQQTTLFHVVEGDESRERGGAIVEETRDCLVADGFDPHAVDTLVIEGGEHDEERFRVAAEYDAVVMYGPEPRLGDRVFGTLPDRISDKAGDPFIVVDRDL